MLMISSSAQMMQIILMQNVTWYFTELPGWNMYVVNTLTFYFDMKNEQVKILGLQVFPIWKAQNFVVLAAMQTKTNQPKAVRWKVFCGSGLCTNTAELQWGYWTHIQHLMEAFFGKPLFKVVNRWKTHVCASVLGNSFFFFFFFRNLLEYMHAPFFHIN